MVRSLCLITLEVISSSRSWVDVSIITIRDLADRCEMIFRFSPGVLSARLKLWLLR